jgi:hypothetical protein
MLEYNVNPKGIAILLFFTIKIMKLISYAVLDEYIIKNYILSYLFVAKHGFATKSYIIEIVST